MVTKEEIKEIKVWCDRHNLKYTINDDGTVDIDGDVNIVRAKNGRFPIRFGKVTGNFWCKCNIGFQLTTLEGGPSYVGGDYDCRENELTSLKGAPTTVGGHFDCFRNKLTNLAGAPTSVGGRFDCSQNNLTTLEGAPATVGGSFDCSQNNLTTLEGVPATVGRDFNCSYNKLTTLEGVPASVAGDFNCSHNNLTTLEGVPASVAGSFKCSENNLTTLAGGPASVGGDFWCSENNLTSLAGGPASVGGYFTCYRNNLTTLEGGPASVGGAFNCSWNNLTTLEGVPASVGGWFDCSLNNLTTLEGAPTSVGGWFDCSGNKLTTLEGIENTTIEGELKIGESVTSFDFVPKKFNKVTCGFHEIIVTDNMNLERGHYIIAPRVRTLGVLCKNSVTKQGADKTMDLFHLPMRVDILGTVPPDIEKIEPSSISNLELHVPKGDVEVYSKHKQWKRAFLITDDNGTILFSNPKNAAPYEEYLVQKAEEEEKRKQREIERAKAEKQKQMQNVSHETLCRQLLAAYQPEIARSWNNTYTVNVTLKSGVKLTLEVQQDENPLTLWQNLFEYIEKLDNIPYGKSYGSENEVKLQ